MKLVQTLFSLLVISSGAANATVTLVNTPIRTNCSAVQLTSMKIDSGSNLLGSDKYVSTSCKGFDGNDPQYGDNGFDSYGDKYINTGMFGDGLLNGESFKVKGSDYAFTSHEFANWTLDPKHPGEMKPGWIGLAAVGSSITHNQIGSFKLSDVLTVKMWAGNNTSTSSIGATSGGWSVTVNAAAVDAAKKLLGNSYFDHLNIVLKSTNAFVSYNFDFNQIFSIHNSKASNVNNQLSLSQYYTLAGTWGMNDFLNKNNQQQGLSHSTFAAHDPVAPTTDVPAPSTLALFGLSLLGLGVRRFRK